MSSIRVLLADMAPLDGDIVARIAGERPDMTIVGKVDGSAQVGHVLRTSGVDVLLLSAYGPGQLCPYLGLMWTHPRLGVIVVDPRDPRGVVRELRLAEKAAGPGDQWPENLVDAIRSAAGKTQAD